MLPVKHNCKATFADGVAGAYRLLVPVEKSAAPGRKIRELRQSKGLTQQQLADLLGKKRPMISEWENGQGLTAKNLRLVADALDVSPSDIGDAWDPEGPRPSRQQAQSDQHPPHQSHVVAPPPLSTTGADMGPGDQGLVFVQSVWGILTPELRQDLLEHARDLAHKATAPPGTLRKKASR
jgi:transcriptional regulator with XRE-family HTH domain